MIPPHTSLKHTPQKYKHEAADSVFVKMTHTNGEVWLTTNHQKQSIEPSN